METSVSVGPHHQNNPWHALRDKQVLDQLSSPSTGLSSKEAKRRLSKYGPNLIQRQKSESLWRILFRQINNPLIYILLVATVLTIIMGKSTDGVVILSVAILNVVIGFVQERKAGQTIQSLLTLIPEQVMVLRDNDEKIIPAHQLVLGDWVILQAGDRISADMRIIESNNLTCDEASLTGESFAVLKKTAPVEETVALADRISMAFSGTLVTAGTGTGIVVTTGIQTEFGKISELLKTTETLETPLEKSLKGIARSITYATLVAGFSIFIYGFIKGYPWMEAALSAVTLAVALIPEGLPAIITIASAFGVRRMAMRHAIIRHLSAVETLGSTSVICSDKTGTLTENKMTVQALWTPQNLFRVETKEQNNGLEELIIAGLLCNDSSLEYTESGEWRPVGDPTEIALVVVGKKYGFIEDEIRKKWPRTYEIPFDPAKKIMATLNNSPNGMEKVIFLKGAPEALAKLGVEISTENLGKLTQEGMRVLAFAKKIVPLSKTSISEDELTCGLEFLGLQGMIDPPREAVKKSIMACQNAGITIKMITGDHPGTAIAIAKKLGIISESEKALTGFEIEHMSDDELQKAALDCHVFARLAPEHKLKLVMALQEKGKVVAMTGDGVNDAAALKRANIGVAMGITGTAVAKESADMILADDNFSSIEAAVEEGRRVYDNMIKSVAFILPTSLAQSLIIAIAVLFFPVADGGEILRPMQPVQVLWVNLIVAITLALPLAFEALEPDVMKRPPRSQDTPILNGLILFRVFFVAIIIAGGTIGLFLWEYEFEIGRGTPRSVAITEAQTMAVTTIVLFQVFYLLNCRSLNFSLLKIGLFSNRMILLGIIAIILAQVIFIYVPEMNDWFHSSPLRLEAWGPSALVAFTIFPVIAFEKWLRSKMTKKGVDA